jgi:hypothetical protein
MEMQKLFCQLSRRVSRAGISSPSSGSCWGDGAAIEILRLKEEWEQEYEAWRRRFPGVGALRLPVGRWDLLGSGVPFNKSGRTSRCSTGALANDATQAITAPNKSGILGSGRLRVPSMRCTNSWWPRRLVALCRHTQEALQMPATEDPGWLRNLAPGRPYLRSAKDHAGGAQVGRGRQLSADSRNSPRADREFPAGGHQISP